MITIAPTGVKLTPFSLVLMFHVTLDGMRVALLDARDLAVKPRASARGAGRARREHGHREEIEVDQVDAEMLMVDAVDAARGQDIGDEVRPGREEGLEFSRRGDHRQEEGKGAQQSEHPGHHGSHSFLNWG